MPESQAYMDLLAFERKLDATITRKKLDMQEVLKRPMKVKRRLRIYVSHTFYPGKEADVRLAAAFFIYILCFLLCLYYVTVL